MYKGSPCKVNCGGHRAGAAYARRGGQTPSGSSSSFNNGMKIANGTFKRPKKKKKQENGMPGKNRGGYKMPKKKKSRGGKKKRG